MSSFLIWLLDCKKKQKNNDFSIQNLTKSKSALISDILQELLDLINQSFEPPDLDLPESVMNMSCTSGGGMLEQWLGK